MKSFKRVLAIANPLDTVQPAIDRADLLAHRCGARLRIQAIVHHPELDRSAFLWDGDAIDAARQRYIDQASDWLAHTSRDCLCPERELEADWGHPFDRAVLSVVDEWRPDIVIFQPRQLAQSRLGSAEWRLIRHCRQPIWLARQVDFNQAPAILAAVDPGHQHDPTATLDQRIIECANTVAAALASRFEVLYAMGPVPGIIGVAQDPMEYEEGLRESAGETLRDVLARAGAVDAGVQLVADEPLPSLQRCCEEESVDLLIMGMLARSAMADRLIGSTARRVIPALRCDVLLVKP